MGVGCEWRWLWSQRGYCGNSAPAYYLAITHATHPHPHPHTNLSPNGYHRQQRLIDHKKDKNLDVHRTIEWIQGWMRGWIQHVGPCAFQRTWRAADCSTRHLLSHTRRRTSIETSHTHTLTSHTTSNQPHALTHSQIHAPLRQFYPSRWHGNEPGTCSNCTATPPTQSQAPFPLHPPPPTLTWKPSCRLTTLA